MNGNFTGLREFVRAPLEGRSSPSRVFWLYGGLGSVLYGCLGLVIPPEVLLGRLYSLGGLLMTLYVIVATYRCAKNCRTEARARWVRISCVISFLLLPLLAYLEFSGALSLESSQIEALGL